MASRPPVAITAYSLCCGLGRTTNECLAALRSGQRGLRAVPFEVPFDGLTGTVPFELPPLPESIRQFQSRTAQLAVFHFEEIRPDVARAIERWGSKRVAMVLGTSTGGIFETEIAFEQWLQTKSLPKDYDYRTRHPFHAFTEALAEVSGIGGPRYVVSTACSSSAKALASGRRLLELNLADAVLVGGVDGLCNTTVRGFNSLGVMAAEPCRPFGLDRPGMNVGEAASYLLMERDGPARAWLRGVGESSDAYHMSSPEPEGRGARAAMLQALRQAQLGAERVDYVNAHGTGTRYNDAAEAKALLALFGPDTPVVSTKAYTGHTLGACGAVEATLCIVALEQGWIPAALGSEPQDPEMGIHLPRQVIERPIRFAISNAFAFGGNNCSVLLEAV